MEDSPSSRSRPSDDADETDGEGARKRRRLTSLTTSRMSPASSSDLGLSEMTVRDNSYPRLADVETTQALESSNEHAGGGNLSADEAILPTDGLEEVVAISEPLDIQGIAAQAPIQDSVSPGIQEPTLMCSDDPVATGGMISDETNPVYEFPFITDETPFEALQSLFNYFETDPSLHNTIMKSVSQWIDSYLNFAEKTNSTQLMSSYMNHLDFWKALPELAHSIMEFLLSNPNITSQNPATDHILGQFMRLTAQMLQFDQDSLESAQVGDSNVLHLPCLRYLRVIHSTIARETHLGLFQPIATCGIVSSASYTGRLTTLRLLINTDVLLQLATKIALVSESDADVLSALVPVCTVAWYITHDVYNSKDALSSDAIVTHKSWALNIFQTVSTSLKKMVSKNASSMHPERTKGLTSALAWILHFGLSVDMPTEETPSTNLESKQTYKDLPSQAVTDAWAWQLTTMTEYIKSSSMQLRVMGMTSVALDLTEIWRYLDDSGDKNILPHLGQILIQTGILDYILGNNSHPEIVAESMSVFGLLAAANLLSTDHLSILLENIISPGNDHKAEAMSKVLTGTIGLLSYEYLMSLCDALHGIPIEMLASHLRQPWDSLGREILWKAKNGEAPISLEPLRLWFCITWQASIVVDEGEFKYADIQLSARQRLRQLLDQCENFDFRDVLLDECLAGIKRKDHATSGIMWCMSVLIRSQEMQRMNNTRCLATSAIDEIEHAIQEASRTVNRSVLHGKTNQARCTFLRNLFVTCGNDFSDQFCHRTWRLLVNIMAISSDDQITVWRTLEDVDAESSGANNFVEKCIRVYSEELSGLQLCEAMLNVVQTKAVATWTSGLNNADAPDISSNPGTSKLWRFVKESQDEGAAERAIAILVNDIYLRSDLLELCSQSQCRRIHSSLVRSCLQDVTKIVRCLNPPDSMVESHCNSSKTELRLESSRQTCSRILKFLSYFVQRYQAKRDLYALDLRPFMSSGLSATRGEPAGLLYQSFDGNSQTDIKPLAIGSQNTVRCLLTQLKEATGFESYRLFYRGRQFLPTDREIYKSLKDLDLQNGLLLVKREDVELPYPTLAREGCSIVEQILLNHFSDLWQHWPLGGTIAYQTCELLKLLPAEQYVASMAATNDGLQQLSFDSEQPMKCLYIAHAIRQHIGFQRQRLETPTETDEVLKKIEMTPFAAIIANLLDNVGSFSAGCRQQMPEVLDSLLLALHYLLDGSEMTLLMTVCQSVDVDQLISGVINAMSTPTDITVSIIDNALRIIIQLSMANSDIWSGLVNSNFQDALFRLMTLDTPKTIRMAILTTIKNIVQYDLGMVKEIPRAERASPLLDYLLHFSLQGLQSCVDGASCSEEFMTTVLFIVKSLIEDYPSQISVTDVLQNTIAWLKSYKPKERIEQHLSSDTTLAGIVSLMHTCALSNDSFVDSCITMPVMRDILWPLLMPTEGSILLNSPNPLILNPESRKHIYDLLHAFAEQSAGRFKAVADRLRIPLEDDVLTRDDTVLFDQSFNVDQSGAIKGECGYIGLYNLSNTCYLNSLITQLFMNLSFREFVFNLRMDTDDPERTVLFNLQKVFALMQGSVARLIKPYNLVKSIKTFENSSIDENNQMDVDEFYSLLFDRLEAEMSLNGEKKALRGFYGGHLVQQIKSQECDHISEKVESFSAIQCEVRGNSTLQESLHSYVTGEIMDGDNKYRCASCDRHVNAVKRACLKEVPENLIFHLKRFDFNLRTMRRGKINDYFTFPEEIDMTPFTLQYLSGNQSESVSDIFVLVGMIIHTGTAESGHYYSMVKEKTDLTNDASWIKFNDEVVTPWSADNMEAAAFGGVATKHHPELEEHPLERMNSAYMLFYQRRSVFASQAVTPSGSKATNLHSAIPARFREYIDAVNFSLYHTFCLFDDGYGEIVENLFQLARRSSYKMEVDHSLHERSIDTALGYLCRVSCRKRNKASAIRLIENLIEAAAGCLGCAVVILSYFSEAKSAFRVLLQRNPDSVLRSDALKMLLTILDTVKRDAPMSYAVCDERRAIMGNPIGGTSACETAIEIFDYMWQYLPTTIRSWDTYFTLLSKFAERGRTEALQLLNAGFLTRSIRILSSDSCDWKDGDLIRVLKMADQRNGTACEPFSGLIRFISLLFGYLDSRLGPESIVDDETERQSVSSDEGLPWTAGEVTIVHECKPSNAGSSLFVERLLLVGQREETTIDVLVRLIRTGPMMEAKVFNTLMGAISANTELPLDPFIQASAAYISCTTSFEHGEKIANHMAKEAKTFNQREELSFLTFLRALLQPNDQFGGRLRRTGVLLVPTWGPHTLASDDEFVRAESSSLLKTELFGDQWEFLEFTKSAATDLLRQLSSSCLLFVVQNHIREQSAIQCDAATNLFSMVDLCREEIARLGILGDEEMAEMQLETTRIMKAAQGLMIFKVVETESEWDEDMDIDDCELLLADG